MRARVIAGIVVVLAAAGGATWWFLRGGAPVASTAGRITLTWAGTFRGAASLPATVNWCPGKRIAIIEAVSHDTGFMVVLHERDSLVKGYHAVLPHEFMATGPRPAAVASLRWPQDSATLVGFRGVQGKLELAPAAGRISGTFEFQARQPGAKPESLLVTGSFAGLAVESRAAGCD